MFQTKVVWLEGEHKMVPLIWLWIVTSEDHMKVAFNFLNGTPYFLLHILI